MGNSFCGLPLSMRAAMTPPKLPPTTMAAKTPKGKRIRSKDAGRSAEVPCFADNGVAGLSASNEGPQGVDDSGRDGLFVEPGLLVERLAVDAVGESLSVKRSEAQGTVPPREAETAPAAVKGEVRAIAGVARKRALGIEELPRCRAGRDRSARVGTGRSIRLPL